MTLFLSITHFAKEQTDIRNRAQPPCEDRFRSFLGTLRTRLRYARDTAIRKHWIEFVSYLFVGYLQQMNCSSLLAQAGFAGLIGDSVCQQKKLAVMNGLNHLIEIDPNSDFCGWDGGDCCHVDSIDVCVDPDIVRDDICADPYVPVE